MGYGDDVLDALGALSSWQLGRDWVRLNCPVCVARRGSSDRRMSLSVRGDTGYYQCWRCGVKGFIPGGSGSGGDFNRRKVARQTNEQVGNQVPVLPQNFEILWPTGGGRPALCLENYRRYLLDRGLSQRTATEANIGAVPGSNRWDHRVLVPIYDVNGDLSGWSARSIIHGVIPKYLYPRGMSRGIMYNEVALTRPSKSPVFVVEGVFDALALWPNAVALLGKPSGEQAERIATLAERPVVVALDGDAWEAGWSFAHQLKLYGVFAASLRLPPGEDPGTLGESFFISDETTEEFTDEEFGFKRHH